MERGLIWLPLLGLFMGLAWAGWNEYQKVEAYRAWAASFERAKYDVLAVLGQTGERLTWGKPTRHGPIALQSIDRSAITAVQLWVKGDAIALPTTDGPDPPTLPSGEATIALHREEPQPPLQVPFTDSQLAYQWSVFLQRWLKDEAQSDAPSPVESD